MDFDFDKIIDRRHTNSLKWEVSDNELPMWVADMDFKTSPAIIEALAKKVELGVFGYSIIPEKWYKAIVDWWKKRYAFDIEKDWLQFCTGTVAAVTCAVKRMTNTGDNILVQTPVYNIFFNSIENHGRHILESKLKYEGNKYYIDFADLEEKLSNPITTMMILCNPHNPIGKAWSREDLSKIGELCKKYNVIVLSDEVHCDLTEPNTQYTPFAKVSEACKNISITCISPSKAFNVAGLHSAAVIIPNEGIRNNMVKGLNADEIAEPNVFAIESTIAAYTEGEQWLEALRVYLYENKKCVNDFLQRERPTIISVNSNATYLMWLDCSGVTDNVSKLCEFIRAKTGLYLSAGVNYRGNGKNFIRMNIACPKKTLIDGLSRLKSGVSEYQKHESAF